MKRIKNLCIILGLMLMMSSCAKSLFIDYQMSSENTGTIELVPTKPTLKTYVTINNNLVVDKKKIKRVTINNVPNNKTYNISYSSESSWYKSLLSEHYTINMEGRRKVSKIVDVPPYSAGYWIFNSVIILFSLALMGTVVVFPL